MKFISLTKDKISFTSSFFALINLFCDANFDLVSVEIPNLIHFELEHEKNPEVFSAAVHILAVLTDNSLVGDSTNRTIQIISESGFLDKMGSLLKFFFLKKLKFKQ